MHACHPFSRPERGTVWFSRIALVDFLRTNASRTFSTASSDTGGRPEPSVLHDQPFAFNFCAIFKSFMQLVLFTEFSHKYARCSPLSTVRAYFNAENAFIIEVNAVSLLEQMKQNFELVLHML